MHVVEQVMFAVDRIAEFAAWVAALYPWKVKCFCVVGNHGRVGKKGEQSPLSNFDHLVYWILAEKLAWRGQRQTAYQVLVASAPEILAQDRGDLWDERTSPIIGGPDWNWATLRRLVRERKAEED